MNRIIVLIVALAILGFAAASSLVIVDQGSVAVLGAGQQAPVLLEPGLHAKLPPPFASVVKLDTRAQTLDLSEPITSSTADHDDLLVTPLLVYRIVEPLKFYLASAGDPADGETRLESALKDALDAAMATRPLSDVLGDQNAVAEQARPALATAARALGVDVLDLRLARVDLPAALADAAYRRMNAAQQERLAEVRAQGAAQAQQIRSDADRDRQAILSAAYQSAQTVKGAGDAQAAAIAADAYGRDPQFYQFYASLQAYRKTFKANDVIVVDPDSDFFKFMRNPNGTGTPPAAPPVRKR